ncbi:MFS transporter DHA1 family bicyclomycin/chloramphenicol resistance protein [Sphingomonas sp. LH128]|uniref:Bcr/CflA family efflux transporter n=2 Tax=Sphingomonadales TaxID=204457 RepID=A0A031JRG7_9SPHN|nr:MFS transporter DHA1 family bicyclomycin/chloramphenicol resistance protein [Sphingomonas sp. LH128]EZP80341.1 MFS transporter DHA1 family bicyclomycin/chloramphenicol resistance protein [Novosphingobium resinovorum]
MRQRMTSPAPRSDKFPMGELEFVVMMASFQALQALAIDVMLPALGAIGTDLHLADPNRRQLIVGVFLICSGLGSLFPGALADRFGRRPVVLTAITSYVLLSMVCAVSASFELLLIARGMMGFVTSAMIVMPMTILRDRFEGDRMARSQSLIAMTFMVVPMIAPMLGQTVLLFAGWRWIFGIMGGLAACVFAWAWTRLPETLHPDFRQPVRFGVIAGNMGLALKERASLGYFLGAAFVQAALFGYINSAQQLVGEHFGAGTMFPVIFGCMALVMACTNFANARIVERFGARRVSHAALLCYIAVGALHLVLAMRGEGLWTFLPLMTLSMCMLSFIGSNFQAISLQPFARIAGAAASVMAFVRMVLGATLGSLIGQAYDGTARPIMAAMVICGLIALVLVLYSEGGRLFRRLNPPEYYRNAPPPVGH